MESDRTRRWHGDGLRLCMPINVATHACPRLHAISAPVRLPRPPRRTDPASLAARLPPSLSHRPPRLLQPTPHHLSRTVLPPSKLDAGAGEEGAGPVLERQQRRAARRRVRRNRREEAVPRREMDEDDPRSSMAAAAPRRRGPAVYPTLPPDVTRQLLRSPPTFAPTALAPLPPPRSADTANSSSTLRCLRPPRGLAASGVGGRTAASSTSLDPHPPHSQWIRRPYPPTPPSPRPCAASCSPAAFALPPVLLPARGLATRRDPTPAASDAE
ncbi:hypothetical protein BS78_06G276100 [Paspalum vaginatum]|nr:hypothetical protein BS78_06G276100 [Paspalum vaginatum]